MFLCNPYYVFNLLSALSGTKKPLSASGYRHTKITPFIQPLDIRVPLFITSLLYLLVPINVNSGNGYGV